MKSIPLISCMIMLSAAYYYYLSIPSHDKQYLNANGKGEGRPLKTTTIATTRFTLLYGRISFSLHKITNRLVNPPGKYDPVLKHQCRNTSISAFSLDRRGVFDFKTSVSTNLNIIFIGDSVSSQLAQAFDASVTKPPYDYKSHSVKRVFFVPKVQEYHICATQSVTRGGGFTAYMRNNFMMTLSNLKQKYECKHGARSWGLDLLYSLLDNQHASFDNMLQISSGRNASQRHCVVGSFDAAVLNIPFGWVKNIKSITREKIVEEINLVSKYFGVDTVIISTISFNNNVKTLRDLQGIEEANDMIRQVARSWMHHQASERLKKNVRWILVQEFGKFTTQMIWTNAKHMGYRVPLNFFSHGWSRAKNAEFLLDRLQQNSQFFWPPSIPMVCAGTKPPANVSSCTTKNAISPDGMHWCTSTVGPRYSASVSCLLGCVYNVKFGFLVGRVNDSDVFLKGVRVCERECNDQFMSLEAVRKEIIDADITMYSKVSRETK